MPLIINGINVKKISGPVSMYLLYPTTEYTKNPVNKYAPIFILFGDSHESVENYCKSEDKEEGEFKIFDDKFLKLFSDAVEGKESEKSGTIDFYIEGGDLHNEIFKRSIRDYPLSLLRNLFKTCYYNTRLSPKRKIANVCNSIKNIRWQSGDIRKFVKKEGKCSLYSEFSYIISKCRDIVNVQEKEKQFKELLRISISNNMGKPIIEEFTGEEMYVKHVLSDKCLIYKQLNNINLIKGKEEIIKDIQSKFKNYINDNYNILDLYDDKTIDISEVIPKIKEIHDQIITAFKTSTYSDKINVLIDTIYKYYTNGILRLIMDSILLRDAVLPDLYILARSYKYMYTIEDNDKHDIVYPIINICYFGNEHIIRMRKFLISNGYDEGIKIDLTLNKDSSKQPNRCLDISDTSNIANTLIDLNELIGSIKEDRERFPPSH